MLCVIWLYKLGHAKGDVSQSSSAISGSCLAIKGDWPFLRKSMGLATGFTSTYKCHHCMEMDPELYGSYVAYILEIGSFS